jgi:hypothetical protein
MQGRAKEKINVVVGYYSAEREEVEDSATSQSSGVGNTDAAVRRIPIYGNIAKEQTSATPLWE